MAGEDGRILRTCPRGGKRMGTVYIYAITDTRSGQQVYVGRTNNPEVRLDRHRASRFYRRPITMTILEEVGYSYPDDERDVGYRAELDALDRAHHEGWPLENDQSLGCHCEWLGRDPLPDKPRIAPWVDEELKAEKERAASLLHFPW
jgi:hypothetical protein